MNKQELIERIDSKMFAYPLMEPETEDDTTVEFKKGFNCACDNIKCLVQQKLDEPKKVVVPKFVADWIELCKGLECTLYCSATSKLRDTMHIEKAKEVSDWLDTFENHELFARAWLDGYEVKKEPLYYVKFDILYLQKYLVKNVETNQFYLSNNENVIGNYEQVRFTEQEIKAIDERYWPFAVMVEDEK